MGSGCRLAIRAPFVAGLGGTSLEVVAATRRAVLMQLVAIWRFYIALYFDCGWNVGMVYQSERRVPCDTRLYYCCYAHSETGSE